MAEIFIKFLSQQHRDRKYISEDYQSCNFDKWKISNSEKKKSRIDEIFIMRTNNKS
jgi:hypothetical protein